jgi:replicative DNA helicase
MLYKEYQPEHEQLLLSAIMIDNSIFDEVEMLASDFQLGTNRYIYETIKQLIERGENANLVTVSALLDKERVTDSYLSAISSRSFTAANAKFYADRIKAVAQRHEIKRLALSLNEWIGSLDNDEIVYEIEKSLSSIPDRGAGQIIELKSKLMEHIEELERRFANHKKIVGITTGFEQLDIETGGFRDGEFIVIGARPSMGKTTLALNIAKNICLDYGLTIGFFSLETASNILIDKLIACQAGINAKSIQTGEMKRSDFQGVVNASSVLSNNRADFYIDDTSNIRLSALRNRARMMKRRGARIIFVDYLTLITTETKGIPRHEQIAEVSRALKNLARELCVPVVVLSQVRRESQGKMPSLADIRESGSIEQDADVIMFINREPDKDATEIDIAKNRNWSIGTCELAFNRACSRFENALTKSNDAWYNKQ